MMVIPYVHVSEYSKNNYNQIHRLVKLNTSIYLGKKFIRILKLLSHI